MRDQFTFYRSFWEAIRRLRRKEDRLSALEGIVAYALDGSEPKLTFTAEGVFILIRPTLDAGRRKAENGSEKGKAKRAQTGSKTKAKAKQNANEGEKEREGEKEGEIEVEVEKENECYHDVVVDVVKKRRGADGGAESADGDADDDADDDEDDDGADRPAVLRPCAAEGPRGSEGPCGTERPCGPEEPCGADDGGTRRIVGAFRAKISPTPSEACLRELCSYTERLGEALVLRAIDAAVDAGARSWRYVQAVLRDWQERGLRSVEDLERAEAERRARHRAARGPRRDGAEPEGDRNAWMDEYL